MGNDEPSLIRLWREKRGEIEPQDLSDNLIVQLGVATEPLNRLWFERTTGKAIKDVQLRVRHPVRRSVLALRFLIALCSTERLAPLGAIKTIR